MKDAIRELISKEEDRAMDDDISDAVATVIENKVEEYNEGIDADDKVHRATLPMAAEVFRRGVGAYKINPESVRPSVPCC